MSTQQHERKHTYVSDSPALANEPYYQKSNQTRRNIAVILIVLGLLWAASQMIGKPFASNGTISEAFDNTSGIVVFDLDMGDLQLEVENRDDILVDVKHYGYWGGQPLVSEQNSRRLTITNKLGLCFGDCGVSYRVVMPAHQQLEIRTSSGDVELTGELGSVDLHTSSGDISVADTAGELKIHSSSGSILLEHIDASVSAETSSGNIMLVSMNAEKADLKTSSGTIALRDAHTQVVQAQTSSGDIRIFESTGELDLENNSGVIEVDKTLAQQVRLQNHSGDVIYRGVLQGKNTLESQSGDVLVELDDAQSLSVSLSTNSGSLHNYLSLDTIKNSKHEIHGSIGSGEVTLNIRTTSGDIEIRE